jgi:hypothetical protein
VSDAERRSVRVAHEVFDRLDAVLGAERGPEGRPSANDFLAFELVEIIEVFANRFDALPRLIEQRSDYRILINRGTIVYAYAVTGQLGLDGAVEIIRVDLEFDA